MNKKLIINSEKYKFKKFQGITLISLVITIIVLIILASVGIYLSLGNNGIFTRAKQAKEVTNKQEATDIINLKITTAQMNKYAEKQEMPTLQELADILYEDNEIEYIALETKVGSKEKITVGEKTSIFTKLNEYPYEFEINGKLQLASINGVKIANQVETKTNPSTILYPNGTEENPYSIPINSRIVVENPYPGHNLYLVPQIQVDGLWGDPCFVCAAPGGKSNEGYGIRATQIEGDSTDVIIIQSGSVSLSGQSALAGNGFNIKSSIMDKKPFRLKVVCLD